MKIIPPRTHRKCPAIFWILIVATAAVCVRAASFYSQRLEDPKAVHVSPSGGDDTVALQKAIDQVQETTHQGIVMLAPGNYRISDTIYIWPSIRVIGFGAERPKIILPPHTPGFGN